MFGRRRKSSLEFNVVTTKGGDGGSTSLYSGERLRKDDITFEAIGQLDHLNSILGLTKVNLQNANQQRAAKFIDSVQSDVIALSALVATKPHGDRERYDKLRKFDEKDIERIQKKQKSLLQGVNIEPKFVNPGENELAAWFDTARSQARTAERRIITVIRDQGRSDIYEVQKYVNRLSDLLFVLARFYGQDYEEKYVAT